MTEGNAEDLWRYSKRLLHQAVEKLSAEGLCVLRENPSTLLAGPLVGHTLARSKRFVRWTARVADRLPMALASGWSFALTRMEKHPE